MSRMNKGFETWKNRGESFFISHIFSLLLLLLSCAGSFINRGPLIDLRPAYRSTKNFHYKRAL